MATPLHHEARHSSGSEGVTGGFCMNHSSPLTALKVSGPCPADSGYSRADTTAGGPMEDRGSLLPCPYAYGAAWPPFAPVYPLALGQSTGAVASNQLPPAVPLQPCVSGAAATLCSRSRNQQINPFLGSCRETASSFNPILNQGQGVIPENVGTGRRFLWP